MFINELPSDANSYRESLGVLVAVPHTEYCRYVYLQGCGGRSTHNCKAEAMMCAVIINSILHSSIAFVIISNVILQNCSL